MKNAFFGRCGKKREFPKDFGFARIETGSSGFNTLRCFGAQLLFVFRAFVLFSDGRD
jgi:hypothetical protein